MATDPIGLTGPTRSQAEGLRWRRTSKGLYVPSDVPLSTQQRVVEAGAVLPAFGGVTGWAALHWMGGAWFSGEDHGGRRQRPVWLAVGGCDVRPQRGIEVSAERLDPRDLTEVDGLRITTAVRSVCFEMRYAPTLRLAVVAFDLAAFNDLVSIAEIREYADRHSGWTGIPQCREALTLVDENSWSPRETPMRLVWLLDARLPRPLTNRPVFDLDGRHLGTPDLIDPVSGVAGEYEGALHLEGSRRAKDIAREGAFRGAGLEYVTMTAADGPDPRWFIVRLIEAYDRASCVPASRRRWTLEQPDWWIDTSTVERRRALDDRQRTRLLARRTS